MHVPVHYYGEPNERPYRPRHYTEEYHSNWCYHRYNPDYCGGETSNGHTCTTPKYAHAEGEPVSEYFPPIFNQIMEMSKERETKNRRKHNMPPAKGYTPYIYTCCPNTPGRHEQTCRTGKRMNIQPPEPERQGKSKLIKIFL
jgi:hypothetical protein